MGKLIDLTGKRFDKWKVLNRDYTQCGHAYWNCICECGSKKSVNGKSLRTNKSKSCGCSYIIDVVGKTFGYLYVTKNYIKDKKYKRWECICACGKKVLVNTVNLINKGTISCGRCSVLKPLGIAARNALYSTYRHRAKKKDIAFDINIKDFEKLTKGNCYYCNDSPTCIKKSHHNSGDYIYNTIDRLDNSKGYISGNLAMCCYRCNRIKSDFFTASEMKEIAEKYIKPRLESL